MDNQKIKDAVEVIEKEIKSCDTGIEHENSNLIHNLADDNFRKISKSCLMDYIKDKRNLQTALTVLNSVTVTKVRELPEFPKKKDTKDNFVTDCYCKSCRKSETFCQCNGFNDGINICGNLTIVREKMVELDVEKVMNAIKSIPIFADEMVKMKCDGTRRLLSIKQVQDLAKAIYNKFGVRLKEKEKMSSDYHDVDKFYKLRKTERGA